MEVQLCTAVLRNALGGPNDVITAWSPNRIGKLNAREREEFKEMINAMGVLSARAQGLKKPVTDYERIMLYSGSHQQRLYLCSSSASPAPSSPIILKGLIKVGQKDLFITRNNGYIHQMSPLCVLDFYVHHTFQRQGMGRVLFEKMLSQEEVKPHQLGYDKPSNKLHSFMTKHYGLSKYLPQANQFVIYDAYFEDPPKLTVSKPLPTRQNCIDAAIRSMYSNRSRSRSFY